MQTPMPRGPASTLHAGLALVVVVLLVTATLIAWLRPGPLHLDGFGGRVGLRARLGQRFVWTRTVTNTGPDRVILLSARLVPDPRTPTPTGRVAELIGTYAASLDQEWSHGVLEWWPSLDPPIARSTRKPLHDTVLEPHAATTVVFLLRASGVGRAYWRTVEVSYEEAGRAYTTRGEDASPTLEVEGVR